MLEIASVTWKQPERHHKQGTEFICSPFNDLGRWNSVGGAWDLPFFNAHNPNVPSARAVSFCPFCGADLREEKPVLP